MARRKNAKFTSCTADFAHAISGLESFRQTKVKAGIKTTWYRYGTSIPISYRIWVEADKAWSIAGYNEEFLTTVLKDRFDKVTKTHKPNQTYSQRTM